MLSRCLTGPAGTANVYGNGALAADRTSPRERDHHAPEPSPDAFRRLPASPELHHPARFLAAPGSAHRQFFTGVLSAHRPRAGGRQVRLRLLRRPPRHARHVCRRPRRDRQERHPLREDGPDRLPDDHGRRDQASRHRRDLLDDLLRSLPRRPRLPDRRPDDQGPRRLELRHLRQRQRSPQHGPWRRAHGTRPALRPRRRVHGGGPRPLGQLGRRCRRRRQEEQSLRAPRQGSAHRLQGQVPGIARTVHGAALDPRAIPSSCRPA